jgi:hypothetical protein
MAVLPGISMAYLYSLYDARVMTIRLGSMLFLGLGLTIAMLRLWSG